MTIAVIKKITLFGLNSDKAAILSRLQQLGCVQLIDINPQKIVNLTQDTSTLTDRIKKAIQCLNDAPEQASQKNLKKDFDADQIVTNALFNQKLLREANDKRDFLLVRIKNLSPWGSFVFPASGELAHLKLWFYKIRPKDIIKIPSEYLYQEVHRDNLYSYIVVISATEPADKTMPEPRIHTGSMSLSDLENELNIIEEQINDLQEERRQLTRYLKFLKLELASFVDRTALQWASEHVRDHNVFYVLQGWVPDQQLSAIKQFATVNELGLRIEAAAPDEIPPTLMQTYPWANAGIELVNFYQIPSYRALDPSLILFFSFSVFFAMILADAGYGLVIGLLTLIVWRWLGRINSGVWLKPLLILISLFSIIYGVLLGSYFGIELQQTNWLYHLKILNIHNVKQMIMLAIVVGCLHIIVANGMRAWFATDLSVRMQAISFMILIAGIMFMSWGLMNDVHYIVVSSIIINIFCLMMLMIFASSLPVTDIKSFVKRLLHGLESLSHLSALFGDILSYLRLFALGLAGASLAETFNHLAVQVSTSTMHGHGWVLGLLVLLFGQILNILLGVLSAVIHGLRLNYIEFFKWSIKEEGYAYAPLKKTEVIHE